jgi:hypothetical protein
VLVTREFKNDEAGYLQWVQQNADGYVVNVDEPLCAPQYPMVHLATHKLISSPARSNYTTGRYFKVCSTDLAALDLWAKKECQRPLTRCAVCSRMAALG